MLDYVINGINATKNQSTNVRLCNYSEWGTPYVYLKCFVLGDATEVDGESRIRNLSNGKTIGQAVYGL